MKNGTETDVDCGGDACNPCANGLACSIADDCMSGSCIEGKCSACKLGSNLILNGGAEDGVAGVNHDDIVAIPSWTRTGNMTVLKYGSQASYPYPQTPGPTDRGMNVFIGGPSASTTLTQDVDLTACEDLILAGKVQMELSGWLGGLDSDPDYAQLSATFKDMTGADKGTTTIGPVTSADRMGLLSLLERTTTVDVPTEATKAVVTLQAVRSLGSYCNGYADNLSLMLLLK